MRWTIQRVGAAVGLVFLAGGCTQEEIRVYEVPKERGRPAPAAMAMAPGRPTLTWTLPEGWEESPTPSSMRAASFRVRAEGDDRSAEVSVVALPGVSAAMTDIVNMWREQVGLGAVDPAEVAKLVEAVRIGSGDGELFDMVGPGGAGSDASATRILVAIARDNDFSWFFKMTGAPGFVEDWRKSFIEFLGSVSFVYPSAAPSMAASAGPVAGAGGAKPHWTVPEGWEEAPPSAMGLAKFTMGGTDAGTAELTVTVLPGAAGGMLANVNRWRGQLGLAPVDEAGLSEVTTPFEEAGAGAVLVDMTGGQRVVGAVLVREGQSWFYKLVGDPAVVEREKAAFVEFVKTVDYSHAH